MGQYSAGMTPGYVWGRGREQKPVFPTSSRFDRSKRAGWVYRGVVPMQGVAFAKKDDQFPHIACAVIHALGMMPGLPELEPWHKEHIRYALVQKPKFRSVLPMLRKQGLVSEMIDARTPERLRKMLDIGPVLIGLSWPRHWDLVNLSGYSAIGPPSGAYFHHAVLVGWHPGRNAYRVMNSLGPPR